MKKLLILMFSLMITLGASAQYHHYHSRVYVHGGYGFYYPYYDNTFYYPYYYPYNWYFDRPTKLDLKLEDIQTDYQEKIWTARHDKSLSRQERRKEIRRLKHERDQAITDEQRKYYRH